MELHFLGLLIAASTFLIIGLFHPIVIKVEYYWGTRPWYWFLIAGVAFVVGALFVSDTFLSAVLGVFGASSLWSIGELFEQRKRVLRGWFPRNPNRPVSDYEQVTPEAEQ